MTTTQVYAENFYSNTLTSDIISATGDINFTVATPPVNKKGFLIISAGNISKREIIYFHDVIGNTLYVKGINRKDGKTHASGETIGMYDVAEWFNFFSNNISTCFYPEKTGDLTVKIWGGSVLINGTQQELGDTDLSLSDNNTNNIYFDYSDNTVKTTIGSYGSNLLVSQITTAGGVITGIINKVPKALTGLTGPAGQSATITVGSTTTVLPGSPAEVINVGSSSAAVFNFNIPKGEKGDIGEPGPAGQTISDNIVPPNGSTVTTIDGVSITVTQDSGIYTVYTVSGIDNYTADNTYAGGDALTGVWDATGILYENGTYVNKTTGVVSFVGKPAFRDQINNFEKDNSFLQNTTVNFYGRVSFPYTLMPLAGGDGIKFDAKKGTKQYINIANPGTYHLDFYNIFPGSNYEFAINNNSGGAITINPGTITNGNGITDYYSVGGNKLMTTTNQLGVGTHLFVCESFSTAIHISYLGESKEIV